jgi:hypothetical protein
VTNTNPRRIALNLPLLGLWIAAAGVAVLGYWMLQRGTAGQAEFYTAGGTDPAELLSQQSLTTTGGLLLVAGVLGLLLALAAHARARSAAILAERTATDAASLAPVASDDLDGDIDEQDDVDELEASDAAETADAAAEQETTARPVDDDTETPESETAHARA